MRLKNRISKYSGCLAFSAGALARMLDSIAEEEFGNRLGLSASHAFILKEAIEQPGVQPSEVAKELHLKPSTITRLVDKLAYQGLIERRQEGKIVRLFATALGQEMKPQVLEAWEAVFERYGAILGRQKAMELTSRIYEAVSHLSAE